MPRRPPAFPAVRDAALAQYRLVVATVEQVPDGEFVAPTRLGRWTVADLVSHLAGNLEWLVGALHATRPNRAALTWRTYYADSAADAPDIAARAVERAAGLPPTDLRERLRVALADAHSRLAMLDRSRPVTTGPGTIELRDYLMSRCVEGVVHGLDLQAAVRVPARPADVCAPGALGVTVWLLAELLAERAPGRAVELRIPGPSGTAVQCLEGPAHTRGTPGSVVEADPVAFVELATGRLTWGDALRAARVSASGRHADLSPYLPVLS